MTSTTERAHRRFKRILLAGALLASAASTLAQAASPIGLWHTIDDKTGQPKAVVRIVQDSDGTLTGIILDGVAKNNDPTRRCTACTDSRKDQLLKGMTIINGMKQDGDAWDGGEILDPENGKLYKCKMHLDEDGEKLVVRGYIGVSLLGRSQTWVRLE